MSKTEVEQDAIPFAIDEGITLGEMAMGEVNQKFPAALKEVAANILSFDYPGKTKREINIKIVLEPSDDRAHADVDVQVTTKLAQKRPVKTKLYFTPAGNEIAISEDNPEQPNLRFK